MSAKHTVDAKVRTLKTGLAMGEWPRWHEDRLWLADWGAQEILALDIQGKCDVVVRVPFVLPFCIDWLLNGTLLIVSGARGF
jgi:sugar lactone lactonase YvrE